MDRETDQRLKIIFKIFLCNEDEGILNRFHALREVTQLVPLEVSYEFINLSYTYVCLASTETRIRRWKLFSSCRQRKMLRFQYFSFRKS